MLIVVVSQGKQQAALEGPRGASRGNQRGSCGVKIREMGSNWLQVLWRCPAVSVFSACNPLSPFVYNNLGWKRPLRSSPAVNFL